MLSQQNIHAVKYWDHSISTKQVYKAEQYIGRINWHTKTPQIERINIENSAKMNALYNQLDYTIRIRHYTMFIQFRRFVN